MALLILICMLMNPVFATIHTAMHEKNFSIPSHETKTDDHLIIEESKPTALSKKMENFLNFLDFREKRHWIRLRPQWKEGNILQHHYNFPEFFREKQLKGEFFTNNLTEQEGGQMEVSKPEPLLANSTIVKNHELRGSALTTVTMPGIQNKKKTSQNFIKKIFKSVFKPSKKNKLKLDVNSDLSNLRKRYYELLEPALTVKDTAGISLHSRRDHQASRRSRGGIPSTRYKHSQKSFHDAQCPACDELAKSNCLRFLEPDLYSLIKTLAESFENIGKSRPPKRLAKLRYKSTTESGFEPKSSTLSNAEKLRLAVLLARLIEKNDIATTVSNVALGQAKLDEKVPPGVANLFLPESSWSNVVPTTDNYIEHDRTDLKYTVSKYPRNIEISNVWMELMKHVSMALDIVTTSKEFIRLLVSDSKSTDQMTPETSKVTSTKIVSSSTYGSTTNTTILTTCNDSNTGGDFDITNPSTTNEDNAPSTKPKETTATPSDDQTLSTTPKDDAVSSDSEDNGLSTRNKENTLSPTTQDKIRSSSPENWSAKMDNLVRTLPTGETDSDCPYLCDFSTQAEKKEETTLANWEELKKIYLKIMESLTTQISISSTIPSTSSHTREITKNTKRNTISTKRNPTTNVRTTALESNYKRGVTTRVSVSTTLSQSSATSYTREKNDKTKTNSKLAKISTNHSTKKITTSKMNIWRKVKTSSTPFRKSAHKSEEYDEYYEIYDETTPGISRLNSLDYIGEVEASQSNEGRIIQSMKSKNNNSKLLTSLLKRTNNVAALIDQNNDEQFLNRHRIRFKEPNYIHSNLEVSAEKPDFSDEKESMQNEYRPPSGLNTQFSLKDDQENDVLGLDESAINRLFQHYYNLYNYKYRHANYGNSPSNIDSKDESKDMSELVGLLIRLLKENDGLESSRNSDSNLLRQQEKRMSGFPDLKALPMITTAGNENKLNMPSVFADDLLGETFSDQDWSKRKFEQERLADLIASHLKSAYKPQFSINSNKELEYLLRKPPIVIDND